MCDRREFDQMFEELGKAGKEFGDFIRKAADEGRWHGGPSSFRWEFDSSSRGDLRKPRVNVRRGEAGALVFEFRVPGYEERDLTIAFSGDLMVFKAKAGENAAGKGTYERVGFTVEDIDRREYPVPAAKFAQNEAKAVYRNGILTVTIPSRENAEDPDAIKIEIVSE